MENNFSDAPGFDKRMDLRTAGPVLGHIHVPKTAGTSLCKALDTALTPAAHVRLYFDEDTDFVYGDNQLGPFLDDPRVHAFSSHFVRRFPVYLGQRRIHYITFLREPIEQFISYITYTKKYYAGIKHRVLLSQLPPEMPKLSIRECARWILSANHGVFRNFGENYATNFFARYTVLERDGLAYGDARYRAIRLDAAREILSRFLFVGISERMDESWQLLRKRALDAGIALPELSITHENISSELRGDLSWIHSGDSVGQALLKSVSEDLQLYRWASDRFEEQLLREAVAA